MLSIYNVDWLYLGHEHYTLGGLIALCPPSPERVSVILSVLSGFIAVLNYDWNYFEMVEKVNFRLLVMKILNKLTIAEISL